MLSSMRVMAAFTLCRSVGINKGNSSSSIIVPSFYVFRDISLGLGRPDEVKGEQFLLTRSFAGFKDMGFRWRSSQRTRSTVEGKIAKTTAIMFNIGESNGS